MTHDPQMVDRLAAELETVWLYGQREGNDLWRALANKALDMTGDPQLLEALDYAHQSEEILLQRARTAEAVLEASHHAFLRRIYVTASAVCHNATDESRPDGMILVEPDDWKALNDALDELEEAEAEQEECLAKIGGGHD